MSLKRRLLWIFAGFILLISVATFLLYLNFNKLLTIALLKNFNSSNIADVYELKFEKLSVNFVLGNIKVYNVEMQPRKQPLKKYDYINTSFHLKTHKILLTNVEIFTLLKSNILILERVELANPEVNLFVTDSIPVIFPFRDSRVERKTTDTTGKIKLASFSLKEFDLIDASFHTLNIAKNREFEIRNLSISLKDLLIQNENESDLISYSRVELTIDTATGKLQNEALKYASFKDLKLTIDSLEIKKSIYKMGYSFKNFAFNINALDVHTADSISHITMQSFNLSYKDKSISIKEISFKPNISEAEMQKRYKYQNTQFSGTVGAINIININFDSLIFKKKLFIEEVSLDKITASLFKDKRKPMDLKKFPEYPGQTFAKIPIPMLIKKVKATNVDLVNRELNPDGSYGRANLKRANLQIENLTNISTAKDLTMSIDALIEGKAHCAVKLDFSYLKPEFDFTGKIDKFKLADINPLIMAYTPATIKTGIVDQLSFSGKASRTNSSGSMTFLYHDLSIDLEVAEKAKWTNSVMAFAANTLVASSNPMPEKPARVVQFKAERDMNKAFVNLIIKSVLSGLKETIVMNSENRKAHNDKKKKLKNQNK